jgi:hypothetical protein
MTFSSFSRVSLGLALAASALACGGIASGGLPGPSGTSDAGADASPGVDGSTPVEGGTGVACESDADCAAGEGCAVPASGADVCPPADPAILRQCVKLNDQACNLVMTETACACDGKNITWDSGCRGLPSGWVPEYVAHLGSCADAGVPPPPPPPGPCRTDSDCPSTERCGFAVKEACAAEGQCLPMSDFPLCDIVCRASCACDGNAVYDDSVCCGGAFASEPIAHPGVCFGDGGL